MRIGWFFVAIGTMCSNAFGQNKPIYHYPEIEGWYRDGRDLVAPVLGTLIRNGLIRRATEKERSMVRSSSRDPFYVILKVISPQTLDSLSGAYTTNFLVPKNVKQTNFGRSHSNFYTMTGKCLHGTECETCPDSVEATNNFDATASGCVPHLPYSPPAPPSQPRVRQF